MHNEYLGIFLFILSCPFVIIGSYREYEGTDEYEGYHLILIGVGLGFLALGFYI